jgi:hypothetical protein
MVVLVLLAGCGVSSVASRGAGHERSPDRRVVDYFSPAQEFPGPTWSRFGRAVSGREFNSIAGPRHCDWQQAVMMHVGWPLGTVSRDISHARQYIRDPRGVIDQKYRSGFQQAATLPVDAIDSGYRNSRLELWMADSDPGGVYLRAGDEVERWPRADPPIACD